MSSLDLQPKQRKTPAVPAVPEIPAVSDTPIVPVSPKPSSQSLSDSSLRSIAFLLGYASFFYGIFSTSFRYVLARYRSLVALILLLGFILPSLFFVSVGARAYRAKLHLEAMVPEFKQVVDQIADDISRTDTVTVRSSLMELDHLLIDVADELGSIGVFSTWTSSHVDSLRLLSDGIDTVQAARHAVHAASTLTLVVDELFPYGASQTLSSLAAPTVVIEEQRELLRSVAFDLSLALSLLQDVRFEDFPVDGIPDMLLSAQGSFPFFIGLLDDFDHSFDSVLQAFGHDSPRTYLLLFQNTQERRALGGFLGSMGELTINRGALASFNVSDIYDADGQYRDRNPDHFIPPTPLSFIAPEWSLRDANYYPDGPTSFEHISDFYEQSGHATVDGIITVTPQVVERVLDIIGSIPSPDGQTILFADNIISFLRNDIETRKQGGQTLFNPKQSLAKLSYDLLSALLQLDSRAMITVVTALGISLFDRHILLYSHQPFTQELIEHVGWAGKVKTASFDYLQVVSHNIGGYKTDAVVRQTIRHDAAVQESGRVKDTVTITKVHNGAVGDPEWFSHEHTAYIETLVPLGSTLLSASGVATGFDTDYSVASPDTVGKAHLFVSSVEQTKHRHSEYSIDEYSMFGKTVFGAWVAVQPGEEVSLTLSYLLPEELSVTPKAFEPAIYSLLWQKQAGSYQDLYSADFTVPKQRLRAKMLSTPSSDFSTSSVDGYFSFKVR